MSTEIDTIREQSVFPKEEVEVRPVIDLDELSAVMSQGVEGSSQAVLREEPLADMATVHREKEIPDGVDSLREAYQRAGQDVDALGGAVGGAVAGLPAGPVGVLSGAVLGTVIGPVVGEVVFSSEELQEMATDQAAEKGNMEAAEVEEIAQTSGRVEEEKEEGIALTEVPEELPRQAEVLESPGAEEIQEETPAALIRVGESGEMRGEKRGIPVDLFKGMEHVLNILRRFKTGEGMRSLRTALQELTDGREKLAERMLAILDEIEAGKLSAKESRKALNKVITFLFILASFGGGAEKQKLAA